MTESNKQITSSATETEVSPDLPDARILQDFAQLALSEAEKAGASGAAVSLGAAQGFSLAVRNSELESVEFHRDNDLGITVYFGQCSGHASTADLKPESIIEVVRAAADIARYTQPDPCAGLPDAADLAREPVELDLDHPQALSIAEATALAQQCETAAMEHDARISNSEGASITSSRGIDLLANSLGFSGLRRATEYSVSVSVIAGHGDGMQRDYWYGRSREASIYASAQEIGREAARRTIRRLEAQTLKTAQVPVLFPPEHARGLIGHLVGAASGGALYRRTSFLLDRLNTIITAPLLSVRQRPFIPRAFGAGWFDGEGVATREHDFIREGKLINYMLSSYSARKLEMQTTGNAGGNRTLEVLPTGGGETELMQQAGTGLLVTELMGHGVNNTTGDYSRGASGIWFENGQPAYPVEGITIGGNLLDMFARLVAVGNDVDRRGGIHCGSILLDGITVAGQ